MAAIRTRGQPAVGSALWIQDENAQVSLFCGQEVDDFTFSARNEIEWLNEHMAEIFSKDQMNVTDIFKTPGKLRGKTPRTVRKRNPLEAREPLSDIFSTNLQPVPPGYQQPSPSKATSSPKIAAFKVARDATALPTSTSKQISTGDSGYHGLAEDEMEVEYPAQSSSSTHDTLDEFPPSPFPKPRQEESISVENSTTDRSFHSAREEIAKKMEVDNVDWAKEQNSETIGLPNIQPALQQTSNDAMEIETIDKEAEDDLAVDDSRSSSQESTPARELIRKSSLTFAALPAREPIPTAKSIGARASRTSHLEQTKAPIARNSFLDRLTGGKSLGGSKQPEVSNDVTEGEEVTNEPQLAGEDSDNDSRITKLHNKSSTQRLHERINLLGKSQPPRPTKSIAATNTGPQPQYPDLQKQDQQRQVTQHAPVNMSASHQEDEDDWIKPPESPGPAQTRPPLTTSTSTNAIEKLRGRQTSGQEQATIGQSGSEGDTAAKRTQDSVVPDTQTRPSISRPPLPEEGLQRNITQSTAVTDSFYPNLGNVANVSTTPAGNPSPQRYVDGPLSASKTKLQSMMKTARGLFSSSAGVSAQAKMETLSPSLPARQMDKQLDDQALTLDSAPLRVVESRNSATKAPKNNEPQPAPTILEARKTRSSTEKEQRIKEKEKAELQQAKVEQEKVRQQEIAIQARANSKDMLAEATQNQQKPARQIPRKTQNQETTNSENELQVQRLPSQMQRPKDSRRPIKPAKETISQVKGPPVNIRIGMPSRRVPLTNAALSTSLQESLPPPQPKQAAVIKKTSNASLQSSTSTNNPKSSVAAAKPRALLAAERKKEQDERETQRKLDQKREIERKRAAQQEEARRQEQAHRQEMEKQRNRERAAATEDPKKIAQKQAIEKRRLEIQKKDQRPASRLANDNAHQGIQQAQAGPTNRPDIGVARPPSRQQNAPDPHRLIAANHPVNPSKGAIKRVFDPENDSVPARPAKQQGTQHYEQHENKRRKTNEDDLEEFPIRPTMAPPIRQSGIRKDGPKASLFNNNYAPAPPPAPHHTHAPSLLKSTTSNQAYQQLTHHSQQPRQAFQVDTSKYREGNKIPFAENPNPSIHPQQPFKTPLPSKLAQQNHRQSPQYPNGENIQLAEIETDSEDSESSPDTAQKRRRAASLPEWAQSPNLRQMLERQEDLLDADAVFGPVGSPHMEEMFRERHHRFRSRTSSANWAGQDRLTEDEIRRDIEARARMRREGGWTFGL